MKCIIFLAFLLFHALSYGQSLTGLLTKEVVDNPAAAIVVLEKVYPVNAPYAARYYYVLGRCHEFLNHEDVALNYLIRAKKEFEKQELTALAKDVALEIYLVISSQENYDKYGTTFLDEYYSYAQASKSALRMAYSHNEFAKNAYDIFDAETQSNPRVLDSAFTIYKRALYYAGQSGNDVIKAKVFGNMGVLLTTKGNFKLARRYLKIAMVYSTKAHNNFELFADYYNYGNSYFLEENYTQALGYWQKAEKITLPYYRGKALRSLYKKMGATYDMLNDNANRRKYEKLFAQLDTAIKDREQNVKMHETDVKYQVEEKERQLSSLQVFKEKFYHNRIVFGALLFAVFLLAFYSFVRWKKVDYTRKKLESEKKIIQDEHINTVAQLEKVRQLVIDDHIILKNKTKVYLDKLICIRAEDHYLYIISAEGKTNFVRGKLAQLIEELPPNFVKCHRSYVVNTNYIKSINSKVILLTNNEEIPVSRNFKL